MKAIAVTVLAATLGAGCLLGQEEEVDESFPLRITCTSALRLSGTWVQGAPRSAESPNGCWGVGTWTFTAAIDRTAEVRDITGDDVGDRCGELAGTADPLLEASYSFRVDLVDDGSGPAHSYTLLGGLGASQILQLKITDDGAGDCEGDLSLRSEDGKMEWNLKPSQTEAVISGAGEFLQFHESQW